MSPTASANGMGSPEPLALELGAEGDGVRVEFDLDRIRSVARGADDAAWRLGTALDPSRVSAVRVVSAAFDDGRLLAVAASRPAGAQGHGEESVGGALVDPEGSVVELADVLLSTEYDSQGHPARIGLELYVDLDASPLRVAADRTEQAAAGGADRSTEMSFRMEGVSGTGRLELATPG
jgi:hypothetical protein